MKKRSPNRMALMVATLAIASAAAAQAADNWSSGDGAQVWRNGTNELCWRDTHWTPATAHPDCDGAIRPSQSG